MASVLAKTLKKAIAEALVVEDGPLDGAVMMLWTNPGLTPNENTVYADLTAATFTGYAASAPLTFGTPYLDGETGQWAVAADPVEFRSTSGSPFVGDTVRGYAIYVTGSPNVLRVCEAFEESVVFGSADKVLVVRPEIVGLAGSSVVAV